MALSKAQKEAVMHREGPAIVLAGPGSGKTTVITERTKFLTQQCGVLPIHILVVTFTRAAAQEMQKRFLALTDSRQTQIRFGTFHSLFFEILRHAYHYTGANIASEEEKYRFLREITAPMDIEIEDEAEFLHDVAREISRVKNERIPLEHYYAASVPEELFREIYRKYCRGMERAGKLDYDDLMVYTWELFSARPDILAGWRNRFRYILVDEFQDTNPLQTMLIKLIGAKSTTIGIIGDIAQSIYSFQGAKPSQFADFAMNGERELAQYVINDNRRSTANIVNFCNYLRQSDSNISQCSRKPYPDDAAKA